MNPTCGWLKDNHKNCQWDVHEWLHLVLKNEKHHHSELFTFHCV